MVTRRYRVNGPNIVSNTFDGEVVIINMEKGTYYTLSQSGTDIWNGVTQGMAEETLLDALLEKYQGERAAIENDLATLLAQLVDEGLLVVDAAGQGVTTVVQESHDRGVSRLAFQPPLLQKFTDMEAILMLDPIHEVDATGWPNAKRPD